jgi:hypothetical protein
MMRDQGIHLSDEQLLCFCDAELSATEADRVRSHLEACWTCRTRKTEIENTIADFVRAQNTGVDSQLPPAAGPRALLRARLAEAAAESRERNWSSRLQSAFSLRTLAYTSALLAAIMFGGAAIRHHEIASQRQVRLARFSVGPVPNSALTPGATRPVTRADICSAGYRDMNREVSSSTQREVFRKYGMAGADAKQYEVDYLITPELGGSDDIRNLWPEPYSAIGWNAQVKDALENRLHEMVCDGQIDLTVAQREIASDWISAYKKYFHTEKPLVVRSSRELPRRKRLYGALRVG